MFTSNEVSCKTDVFLLLLCFYGNGIFIPIETQKLPEIIWVGQFPVIGYVICLYQLPLEEVFGFFMHSDCICQ